MNKKSLILPSAGAVIIAGIFLLKGFSSPGPDSPEFPAEEGRPELILAQGSQPRSPNAAPDFALQDLSGRTVSLSSYLGRKVIVMEFWATWCGPCRYTIPMVEKFWKRNAARGVELLLINQQESRERVASYVSAKAMEAKVLLDRDGDVGSAFGVYGLPTLFVIDKEGVLRYKQVGYRPDIEQQLEKVISPLL